MESPKDGAPVDLSSIEAINNLDTARMALRWALERLHSMEKSRSELSERAEHEARMRAKAEEDYRAQSRSLALKASEEDQRQLYYKKLEELVSLRLAGQLDVPALLKRETETTQLQLILEERQVRLEKEFQGKREGLELEYQRLAFENREQTKALEKRLEESLEQRRGAIDKEYVSKLTALRETEIRLKQTERALEERSARFSEFAASQRAQLESDIRVFREEADDHIKLRLEGSRRLLDEKHASLEESWRREKDLLLRELEEWRTKAQEQLPRLLELERKLAEAEDRGKQTLGAAERRLIEVERLRSEERENLLQETSALKMKVREQGDRIRDLEKVWSAAEEEVQQTRSRFERADVRLQELDRAWSQEKTLLLSELEAAQAKTREVQAALLEMEKAAAASGDSSDAARHAAERQAMRLEELRRAHETEKAALLEELAREGDKARDQLAQTRVLEQMLIAAEEKARQTENEAERQKTRLEELRRSWESEKTALQVELSKTGEKDIELQARLDESARREAAVEERELSLSKAAAAWQERLQLAEQKAETAAAKVRDLEMGLALGEESLKAALAETARHSAVADRIRTEMDEWRAKAENQLQRILELEKTLAAGSESLSLARGEIERLNERIAGQHQAAVEQAAGHKVRLEDRELAHQRERAQWLEETSRRERALQEQLAAAGELAQRLQTAEESLRAAQAVAEERGALLAEKEAASAAERTALLQERQKALDLGNSLSAGEAALASAQAEVERLNERIASLQQGWEEAQASRALQIQEKDLAWEREKAEWREEASRKERAFSEQLDLLKQKGAEERQKAADLQTRLAASEEARENARAETLRLNERLASFQQGWEEEKASRILQQRESALTREREKAQWLADSARRDRAFEEVSARTRDLEERAQAAAEAARVALGHAEQKSSLLDEREKAWAQEKALLLAEMGELRQKVATHFPQVLELEKRAAASEEALGQARGQVRDLLEQAASWEKGREEHLAAQRKMEESSARLRDLEEHLGSLREEHEREKGLLLKQILEERQKAQTQLPALLDLEKRLAAAEEALGQTRTEKDRLAERLEGQRAALEEGKSAQERLLKELAEHQQKLSGQFPVLLDLEKRLAQSEQALSQSKAEVERLAGINSSQQQTLEQNKALWTQENERLQKASEDQLSRLGDLEARLAASEEGARSAAHALQENQQRREQAQREEKAALLERISSWEKKFADQQARLKDAEERLGGSSRAHAGEKELLLRELASAQQKVQSQLPALLDLEKRLAASEEALGSTKAENQRLLQRLETSSQAMEAAHAQAQGQAERLTASEEAARSAQRELAQRDVLAGEREKAWAQEKDLLIEEASQWRQKTGGELQRIHDLERRLALAEEGLEQARKKGELEAYRRQEGERAWEAQKAAWSAELSEWEKKASEQGARAFDLERKLARGEEELRQREEKLSDWSRRVAEDYRKKQAELEEVKEDLRREIAAALKKHGNA